MTTTTINSTPGTDYTWTTFPGDWAGTEAGKTWATAYPATWTLDVGEPWANAESLGNGVVKNIAEAWATAEGLTEAYALNIAEAFNSAETYSDTWGAFLNFSEAIAFAEVLGSDFAKPIAEAFSTTEAFITAVGLNPSEVLAVAESFSRVVTYNLPVAEAVTFVEAVAKAANISFSEAFTFTDSFIQRARAIFADLEFRNTDISFDDFVALMTADTPLGNNAWVPLVPGDYEYERALIELKMVRPIAATDLRMPTFSVSADLPERTQRGSVAVGSGGATITFDLPFTFDDELEIAIAIKEGSTATHAKWDNKTKTGFTVKLYNSSGVAVAGDISWVAQGV